LSQIRLSDVVDDDLEMDLGVADDGEGDRDRRTLACLRKGGRHRLHLLQLQEDGMTGQESVESEISIDISEQVDEAIDGG
jgi:hypothetical protein